MFRSVRSLDFHGICFL